MKKKDPLFTLIKSLKKTEKTYFKKFAQLHTIGEKNNYVELFDVINNMKEYDEGIILDRFKGESFLKQLHVIKNYLYNQILKSLRVYHSSNNVDSTIRELIDHTSILQYKGLPSEAAKYLIKAKKLADKYQKYEYLLVLLRLEILIISSDIYTGKKLLSPNEIMTEIIQILDRIGNINQYYTLTIQLFERLRQKGHVREYSELQSFDELLNSDLLQQPENAKSFRSKVYYHYLLLVIYTEKNNSEKAVEYAKKLFQVTEEYPEQLRNEPSNYIAILIEIISTLIHFKMYNEAISYTEKLQEEIIIDSVYSEVGSFLRYWSLKLEVFLKTGRFKEGLQAGQHLEEGLQKYEERVTEVLRTEVQFKLSHLYFGLGDYKKALFWINELLNSKGKLREDIRSFAAIFSLIIHFELENTDLLEYHVKSTYRLLFKRNQLYESERLLIKLIRKLPGIATKGDLRKEFQSIHTKMVEFSNNESYILERNAFAYFDFISWVESKIKNENYSLTVKNNASN